MQIVVQEFADWLATKTGTFHFGSITNCAIAQFLKYKGNEKVFVGGYVYNFPDKKDIRIPADIINATDEMEKAGLLKSGETKFSDFAIYLAAEMKGE